MKQDYKIGDRCRIRQWDDMAAEFGERLSVIGCHGQFISNMKDMCGKPFTIKDMYKPQGCDYMWLRSEENTEGTDKLRRGYWAITTDMLEPYEEESKRAEFAHPTYSDLMKLLWDKTIV